MRDAAHAQPHFAQRAIAAMSGVCFALHVGCTPLDLQPAQAALGEGRYQAAIAEFEALQRRSPDHQEIRRGLAGAHRAEAIVALRAGRCDDAAMHLTQAETVSEPVLADHQMLFECRASQSEPLAAQRATLARVIGLGDTRIAVLRTRLRLAAEAGDDADVVQGFAQLAPLYGLNDDDHLAIVDALTRLGREQEALPHLQRLRGYDPYDPVLRLRVAGILEDGGDLSGAGTLYQKLVHDFPENPMLHLRHADHLERIGDSDAARHSRETADRLRGLAPAPPRDLRPLRKSRR